MAFGGGFDDDNSMMSEINMTPLVDVMLVLLIIFMLTVPVLTHAIKVDLPQAENSINPVKPETLALAVTGDGQIHWNETAITFAELEQRLMTIAQQQPQPEIHLRGDRRIEYEQVIKVMAAVQRAGILKLGFVTDPG
jgi:biopolymer transport protein ExbD